MSVNQSRNSITISQNRAEFIERFQDKNNTSRIANIKLERWDYWYNVSKYQKAKDENYRQKELEKRESYMLEECTFSPKVNNNSRYNYNHTYSNKNSKQIYNNVLRRQAAWAKRKELNWECIKQNETNKELGQCYFKPIMYSVTQTNLGTTTKDVLEDPESYALFINRQHNKRKKEEVKTERSKHLAGSGLLWKNFKKEYDRNYDYTEHKLSSRGFRSKSKSKYSSAKPGTPLIQRNKLRNINSQSMKNWSKDEYYDYLYSSHRKVSVDNNLINNINDKGFIQFNQQIEYCKAWDVWKKELYSLDWMDDA